MLKDGSDSVGALGALNRVYLNIGLFSEEWLRHFNPLAGGKPITPIEISVARKNSAYWLATEAQTPAMALFFLKSTGPHRLKDAPGGAALPDHGSGRAPARQDRLRRALRAVPFEQGAHPGARARPARGAPGPAISRAGTATGQWTKTDEYKQKMRQIVLADDFLDDNLLSTDARVPVTLLETNACSPLATNAIGGNIWDNFSSKSYKDLPSVGTITVHHPLTGEPEPYQMPAGGRGYTRPPSLVSVWSTAPFLLNNSVGKFEASPSVEARMQLVPGLHREAAVAREAGQGSGARRQGARPHRPHDRAELRAGGRRASFPSCCGRCSAGPSLFPLDRAARAGAS